MIDLGAVLSLLNLLLFAAFIGIFFHYVPSYLKEKGKNLATKEDIEGLTHQIEQVRSLYKTDLEVVRFELARQRFAFEKEYEVLAGIWDKLVHLQHATLALRPEVGAFSDKSPLETDQEKLREFGERAREWQIEVATKRPFFSADIYDQMKELWKIVFAEALEYQWRTPLPAGALLFPKSYDPNFWDSAKKNAEEIARQIDQIVDAIRKRILLP